MTDMVTFRADLLGCRGSTLVNITPLTARQAEGEESSTAAAFLNMNPALNNVTSQTPGNVQVLNVLDVPHASNTLEQFAMADVGLLEGIPGGMFDWGVYRFMHCWDPRYLCKTGQWDSFFARFHTASEKVVQGSASVGGGSHPEQPCA